jgi:DNA-binding MarR family transcriptional regulator
MPGLSLPEFRALNYLSQHPEASLNVVAEHLGLTPPTASKLVQKLVTDGVVVRKAATDRRRVCLSLTESGKSALSAARVETRQQLAECLGSLNQKELNAVSMALKALGRAFSQGGVNVNLS